MSKIAITTNKQKDSYAYHLCIATILLVVVLRLILVIAIWQLGDPFILSIETLFPNVLGFFIVPIAYFLSKKAHRFSLLLFLLAYVYSFLYLYMELEGNAWILHPFSLSADTAYVPLEIQFFISILYPTYLIFYGYQFWKMASYKNRKTFKHKKPKFFEDIKKEALTNKR